ncbi:hypothetical protein ABZ153_39820 [Streptomyces sp. NPDC006290]|uniref:hypothetical protein n=1 Tax=Streptomyces sp. NPDC006290 TaxID=3156745 RepID=UPI0033A2B154
MTINHDAAAEEGLLELQAVEVQVEGGNRATVKETEVQASRELLDNLGIWYPPHDGDPNLYVMVKKAQVGQVQVPDPNAPGPGFAAVIDNFTVTGRRVRYPLSVPRIDLTVSGNISTFGRRTYQPFGVSIHFADGSGAQNVYYWRVDGLYLNCLERDRSFSHQYRV